MPSHLRVLASRARARALRIRPVSETPYATHMPVLMALAPVIRPRRVLELGSGPFSTALFLDREVFADLERLVSYEDDPEWERVVRDAVGTDPRLDFRMVEVVRTSVPEDLNQFDLIFIDDSRTPTERSETIRTVRERAPRGVVMIHDYEQRAYRTASKGFDDRVAITTFTPQVGVCWFRGDGQRSTLRGEIRDAAHEVETGKARAIPVEDVAGWKAIRNMRDLPG